MKRQVVFVASLLAVVGISSAMALPPKSRISSGSTLTSGSFDFSKYINANQLLGIVSNQGNLFYDAVQNFGRYDGLYFPYTSIDDILSGANDKTVIYDAGLWMGGRVGVDTLIAVAEYSTEYIPGNMVAGSFDPLFGDSKYRVYKLYHDSLAANPNVDYLQWPIAQGAPTDGGGHPLLLGDQTAWSVYNDAKVDEHTNNAGSTSPLEIEIRQTLWASNDPSHSNIINVKYQLYNNGSKHISGLYVAFWADPDLGGPSDDLVGCDTLQNTFFCYNATNADARYGSTPPAWGGRLLLGPTVPSPGDSAISFGKLIHGYRNLGMTAFSKYINGIDPSSYVHTYNYLQGLTRDGSAYMYNGNILQYANSGDPVTQQGDLDADPADRRLMASCGPISFNPGDSQELIFQIAACMSSDRLSSLSELLYRLRTDTPTDVNPSGIDNLPSAFELHQNYPNPFNAGTILEFSLATPQSVRLDVYNALGQRVVTLIDQFMTSGIHRVSWNGVDDNSVPVASGVYEFKLTGEGTSKVVKGVLLK